MPAATAPAHEGPIVLTAPRNLSPMLLDWEMRRLATTYRVAARQSCGNLIRGTCASTHIVWARQEILHWVQKPLAGISM